MGQVQQLSKCLVSHQIILAICSFDGPDGHQQGMLREGDSLVFSLKQMGFSKVIHVATLPNQQLGKLTQI